MARKTIHFLTLIIRNDKNMTHKFTGFNNPIKYSAYFVFLFRQTVYVKYINIYFVAIAKRKLNPVINMKRYEQVSEVGEIKWMDIEQMWTCSQTT